MYADRYRLLLPAVLAALLVPGPALATDTDSLRIAVDTVWMITAGILVFFMQAGFALLESGMARAKNTVNVLMKNYTDVCFGSIAFFAVGYGLMFGSNPSGWVGEDHFLLLRGEQLDYGLLFFQTMFAATAATIVSGAMAERTRYRGYIIGSVFIMGLIYPIFGAWAWGSLYDGNGWLKRMGFIDFAGSTVVHSVGAWCALAGVLAVGPRLGRFSSDSRPRHIPGHSLPLVALGGFILWFGWFGFNGGSVAKADASIGLIVLNTHLAAAAGVAGAAFTLLLLRRPLLATMLVNGSIGGLVSITAGAASMSPSFALLTGLIAGAVVIVAGELLLSLRIDDVVGAVPVHGFCGVWGTLAAGLFLDGRLFDPQQMLVQIIGVGAAFLWSFPTAYLLFWAIAKLGGLRCTTHQEQRGLDYTEHYELAYPEFQRQPLHPAIEDAVGDRATQEVRRAERV